MNAITNLLVNSRNINCHTMVWNAFAAITNSFQTMLLLLLITRNGTVQESSIFVMAYTIGNLALFVGKFGVRQFQVTDIFEKYNYKEYVCARYISIILMVAFSGAYILFKELSGNGYGRNKVIVVLFICFFKSIEAAEDVIHGRMQQLGRLDIAGKILTLRFLIYIVGFSCTYMLWKNLEISVIINVLISLFVAIYLNMSAISEIDYFNTNKRKMKISSVKNLIRENFPLCISNCLYMYIVNGPKYIIDTKVSDALQTKFNILFMPVFVIALIGNFIFQPYTRRIGQIWADRDRRKLLILMFKISVITMIGDLVITIIGIIWGRHILEIIYNVDLNGFALILGILLISGGIIAEQNLFLIILTAMRKQKILMYILLCIAILMFTIGDFMLKNRGIMGLSVFYSVILILLTVCSGCLIYMEVRNN